MINFKRVLKGRFVLLCWLLFMWKDDGIDVVLAGIECLQIAQVFNIQGGDLVMADVDID